MKPFSIVFKSLLLSMLLLGGSAFAADPVDINTADAIQLEEVLVGIGPAKAQAIIEHRTANGPFKSADELALVKGIGLKTVERNRDLITVGASSPAPAKAGPAATPAGKPAPAPAKPPVARR